MLYSHIHVHAGYILTQWITDEWRFFIKNMYLSLYCKGSKRLFKVLWWEGAGDRTETIIFWPPLPWPSTLCLSRSPDAQPEALGPLCWVMAFFTASYQQLLWSPNSIGVPEGPFGRVVYLRLQLYCNWNSVLTELYNSPTPIRSPTRSLEWHDWSSSSGNNYHAVHRSLSSGASVYECIMGFTLSHFISQIHPRDLFWLLAIGMCHFLPVHHFVTACLLGPKVKIQHRRNDPSSILGQSCWHVYTPEKCINPMQFTLQL